MGDRRIWPATIAGGAAGVRRVRAPAERGRGQRPAQTTPRTISTAPIATAQRWAKAIIHGAGAAMVRVSAGRREHG